MTPDIKKLRDELAKTNNHETSYLRGCIADLIKDKAGLNLLNICLNAGVLQDFFQEATQDTFFIRRCKNRLIDDFFITESAAEKAIDYCKFLSSEIIIAEVDEEIITPENYMVTPVTAIEDISDPWESAVKNEEELIHNKSEFEDRKSCKILNDGSETSDKEDLKNTDELFTEVAQNVVTSQVCLTSAIQRKYRIGYLRAGRIVDQLEAAGIVGENNNSKSRQVLIQDDYSLEQILKKFYS
jgi:hypothetical protein